MPPRNKSITNQKIKSIKIQKLKCINNLNEIFFHPHALTAILGPNGSGKSTILHALASVYMPEEGFSGEDHKLGDFFPRSPQAEWNGSNFNVNISYRRDGILIDSDIKNYGKADDRGSRWVQIYARRPMREVYYLGIDKCVPMIESEKKNNVQYITSNVNSTLITTILSKASYILNKRYTSFNHHQKPNGTKFIGVEIAGLAYSSLSMSAGEQKIFLILDTVFKADKNALILIDELDLLLHDEALRKLILVLSEHAEEKNKQIIFTTHRELIISMKNKVNIRHILSLDTCSYCFEETKPDAINRLTGEQVKPIEIYVEDDVASAIARKICSSLQGSRYVQIYMFGAAINAFTLLASSLIRGENILKRIYILDGDEYSTDAQKATALNRVLTGTEERTQQMKIAGEGKVIQFNLPVDLKPEAYLHQLITTIPIEGLENDALEIITVANSIRFEIDPHSYITNIIIRLGLERSSGLAKIIDLASKHPDWNNYTQSVSNWLIPLVQELSE
ncbi:ATP-binding cassette domain-containing protein [Pectobacterium punjabense]|uniref:ATP-binding cassette domain-containing protein n=1 Tax=Pectobacterium punjabense TaxID=2108399 RepID=A0ABX6L3Q1_9GAMM|nr:AAA family ATPase [Pectobacterium punjabense]MBS4429256.1 AAA family ATPase [Pectobacterium punjabense]PTA65171.1 chromosome segregation protein SMC [Pectobacterium punjabense]QJA20955.1 ATP-binding cassette domain-containing protein [Pectobacterium punjabense]